MTKIKKAIFEIINSTLFGLGIIFMFSPFLLNWWIHGSYERYIWIISGPSPYDKFGSVPFQLYMCLGLFSMGVVIFISAFLSRRHYNKN